MKKIYIGAERMHRFVLPLHQSSLKCLFKDFDFANCYGFAVKIG